MATKLEWKRHEPGVYGSRVTPHATASYQITHDDRWVVRVYEVKTIGAGQYRDVSRSVRATVTADTLALAKAVAQEYDNLGDAYQSHEHGGRSRHTEAVIRAYDAEKAARA